MNKEYSQVLKFYKSSPSKNCKSWQRFCSKNDFKDKKLPVKLRDIHKTEKILALVLLAKKIKRNIQSMYQKYVVKKNMFYY